MVLERILTCVALLCPSLLGGVDELPLEQRVIQHTFANGIHLLILERHFSPTVSIRMMFRAGSVDETSGKTGLAHMFEHMMFKGTKMMGTRDYAQERPLLQQIESLQQNLDREKDKGDRADPKRISDLIEQLRARQEKANAFVSENEIWNLYEREGASTLNAATSRDYTQYMVDLPSNKLELWAILDSDRLKNPVFRQFYQEREVVKEERRMRVDTDPSGILYENFLAAAYQAHPYRQPTIGWESDLDHLTMTDLEYFYRHIYTPDRLSIAIVGDVDARSTVALVEKYFGGWKSPAAPVDVPTEEPNQDGFRRIHVKFDAQPQVVMGYHISTHPSSDHPVAYAVSLLLGSGTTSRLYKRLVEKRKIATQVETGHDFPGERYAPLLVIAATPRHPHTADDVLESVEHEIERLQKEPVTRWELDKVRAIVDVGLLNTLQTNDGMASTLAYNQTVFRDWRYLIQFQQRLHRLTAGDIQTFARKYLTDDNKTVAVLEPLKKP